MGRLERRTKPRLFFLGVVSCALWQMGQAATPIRDPAQFLERTESLRTNDHPQFVQMLEEIHRELPPLSRIQQWHLRYLDAWETMFRGDYHKSEAELRAIMNFSGDKILAAKASALLLSNLGANRRYEEAFALANRLTIDLPTVNDPLARSMLLANLSQMLILAGQTDLAIAYAHMMENRIPPGESLCRPLSLQVAALYSSKRLRLPSPEVRRAIDVCVSTRQPVIANTMQLVLSSLYLDEGHPEKAMRLLNRIGPSITENRYFPHMLAAQVQLAQAYMQLGQDDEARKAALAATTMGDPDDISEWLKDAYQVLYLVERRHGDATAELHYYEHYVAQDKGYLDDISARTIAYETAKQHTFVQKLETESLNKQNHILRLQQALTSKAMETSRLYIALLLLVLISIVLWLFRVKRSQLRFKRLSGLDGLTGILNYQHFIGEAERSIRLMERKKGAACLISIDLDHFKQINDTYGHAAGDAALKLTVLVCQPLLGPNNLFGRLGGEEFGVLLLERTREQSALVAEYLRQAIESAAMMENGCVVSLSASIGLACTGTSGYDLQRLCRDADSALYRAKRSGRNRVVADGDGDISALVA